VAGVPLKERVSFDRIAFYTGYKAGLLYAQRLIEKLTWYVNSGEGKRALEWLKEMLDSEVYNTTFFVARETFTTKYEEEELLDCLPYIRGEEAEESAKAKQV